MVLLLLASARSNGEDLAVETVDANAIGEIVVFSVSVTDAPNAIQSLGVDVTFDESILEYVGFNIGELVTQWSLFDVSASTPGRLRIGGVAPSGGLAAGSTGEVAVLQFRVIGRLGTSLQLVDPVAGVKDWALRDGLLNGVSPENLTLQLPGPTIVGATVSVDVMINDPVEAVDAFGFDLTFDPDVLRLQLVQAGELPVSWGTFDSFVPTNGRARIGGFSATTAWPAGLTARLATAEFEVLDDLPTFLALENLVADMDGWTVTNGFVVVRADRDSDGMPDDFEVLFGLDPDNPDDAHDDGDEDGLSNLQEFDLGTDPTSKDTDGDGVPDGDEISNGFDPLDPHDCPLSACASNVLKTIIKIRQTER